MKWKTRKKTKHNYAHRWGEWNKMKTAGPQPARLSLLSIRKYDTIFNNNNNKKKSKYCAKRQRCCFTRFASQQPGSKEVFAQFWLLLSQSESMVYLWKRQARSSQQAAAACLLLIFASAAETFSSDGANMKPVLHLLWHSSPAPQQPCCLSSTHPLLPRTAKP